jgi:drug/metabolite transporter (DMT)-like permease
VNRAIGFAVVAGLAAATWTICLKLGSTRISAVLGAIVITTGALVVNLVVLTTMRMAGHEIVVTREALWLLAVAGIAAAGVDLFGLLAYQHGLRVTSSFVIGGTSTLVVLLVGFLLLHEPVTWARLLAVVLITAGILLYQVQGG